MTVGISSAVSTCLDRAIQYCTLSPYLAAASPICLSQVSPRYRSVCRGLIRSDCIFSQSCNGHKMVRVKNIQFFTKEMQNGFIYVSRSPGSRSCNRGSFQGHRTLNLDSRKNQWIHFALLLEKNVCLKHEGFCATSLTNVPLVTVRNHCKNTPSINSIVMSNNEMISL